MDEAVKEQLIKNAIEGGDPEVIEEALTIVAQDDAEQAESEDFDDDDLDDFDSEDAARCPF